MPLAAGEAYIGPWVNHRNGYIQGATLTITTANASILVSVLVMLIGWTAIACWELVCFTLHHIRSTSRAKDGLFHQQQVLLRNRMPAIDSVLRMAGLAMAWRSNTPRPFLRSLPIIVLGLINLAFFTAGGVFVSKITNTNSEVLARGKCGFILGALKDVAWQSGNETEKLIGNVLYQAGYTSYREESNYARSCYGTQLDKATMACNIYNKPFIPTIRMDNATCPFAAKACLEPTAISLDSGLVTSEFLGINSKASDRIQVRKKMTCIPIAAQNYTEGWISEQKANLALVLDYLPPNDEYMYFDFGRRSFGSGKNQYETDYSFGFSRSNLNAQDQAYKLSSVTYNPGTQNKSQLIPIADLDPKHADLTIIFLTSKVRNTDVVEDTWFKASRTGNSSEGTGNVYLADEPFTVMGCTEEYQFCNGEDNCGPMSGMNDMFSKPPDIGYNKVQVATWELIKSYLSFMQLSLVIQFLRNELLLATQSTYGGLLISSGVPADQWRTEMANLFNISLAGLQAHGVLHAAPGNNEFKAGIKLHDYIIPETTEEHQRLCKNQKLRSTEYSSISVLGLILVLVFCFSIISLNAIVPHIVSKLQGKWNGKGATSKRAWIEDDVLQLQRIALESRGLGPWKGRVDSVPVLDNYGVEFQRGTYEGGYSDQIPLNEGHVINDGHVPSSWDTKSTTEYNRRTV